MYDSTNIKDGNSKMQREINLDENSEDENK